MYCYNLACFHKPMYGGLDVFLLKNWSLRALCTSAQLNWLKYTGLRKFNVIPNYMLLVYVFIHNPLRLYLTCISSVLRKPKNLIFGPCPPLNHISNLILLNEPSITWAGIGHYLILLSSFIKRRSRAKPVLCLSLMSIEMSSTWVFVGAWKLFLYFYW